MQAANPSASKNSFLFIPNISNNLTLNYNIVCHAITDASRKIIITMFADSPCFGIMCHDSFNCLLFRCHVFNYTPVTHKVNNYFLGVYPMYTFVNRLGAVIRLKATYPPVHPPTRPILGFFPKPLRCQNPQTLNHQNLPKPTQNFTLAPNCSR